MPPPESQSLAQKNAIATREIVTAYDREDLSTLTLGASSLPKSGEQQLLLGTPDFRAAIKMYEGGTVISDVKVLVGGSQLYWASPYGEHDMHRLLDAVVESCRSKSVEPLQRYFQSTAEKPLVLLSAGSMLEEARREQAPLLQAAQYRDVELGTMADFKARLAAMPYSELDTAVPDWASMDQRKTGELDVPVSKIHGASSHNRSWLYEDDRGAEYLYKMARAIKDGSCLPYSPRSEEIQLFKLGERYWISNGRHRVAAVKGMIAPIELTIRAEVIELVAD